MQSLSFVGVVVAGAMAATSALAGMPQAGFRSEARLETPVAAPFARTIEGVWWRCRDDRCLGLADRRPDPKPWMRECRKVSAGLGPLAAYVSRRRAFTTRNLAVCNQLAAKDARPDDARLAQAAP